MTYRNCKKVIENRKKRGTLDPEEMLEKLDVFLLNSRLSEDEYNELVQLMNAD